MFHVGKQNINNQTTFTLINKKRGVIGFFKSHMSIGNEERKHKIFSYCDKLLLICNTPEFQSEKERNYNNSIIGRWRKHSLLAGNVTTTRNVSLT